MGALVGPALWRRQLENRTVATMVELSNVIDEHLSACPLSCGYGVLRPQPRHRKPSTSKRARSFRLRFITPFKMTGSCQ
jgi:hypothetical protein